MNLNGSRIQGQITKLYYSCETFCAGLLRTDAGESIKFRTNFPLTPDEQCVLKGKFTHTQKYGWQFEATGYELHRPMDRQGLIRFLAESTRFKGIGITRAREIVALCSDSQRESLGDAFRRIAATLTRELAQYFRDNTGDIGNPQKEFAGERGSKCRHHSSGWLGFEYEPDLESYR